MKRSILITLVLGVLAAPRLQAQALPTANPEEVGMSTERLERVGTAFESYAADGRIAGAVGLVARRGRLVYEEAWGMRDLAAGDPLETTDIFGICSMTKPVTSVAVMMLYEEGHFMLTDPVSRYMPEFRGIELADLENSTGADDIATQPMRRAVTIRDLLSHTAGLTYGSFSNTAVDQAYRQTGIRTGLPLPELVDKITDVPLAFPPGERWHYSLATDVLGRFIEVISGQSFASFAEERIFEPLGMDDTAFEVPESKRDRLSLTYQHAGVERELEVAPGYGCIGSADAPSGGAGLASTAQDYLRFAQMLLNGGELEGTRILGAKTIELMTADQLQGIPNGFVGRGWGFGLGFAVRLQAGLDGQQGSVGEYYWWGVAGTSFWIDPVEELIGVFMVQLRPNRDINWRDQYKNLVYQAITH